MKFRIVAAILVLLILIFSFTVVSAESNTVFLLTDPVTDLTYEVYYSGKDLSVKLKSEIIGKTLVQDINACSMYNNILYLYCSDNLNRSLFVYCFDFYNDSINSFAVNIDAFGGENCFASDGERVYFVSGKDTKRLCVYENANVAEYDLKAQIKALLLIESGRVIAVTTGKTYMYNNSEIIKADCSLSPDIRYVGNGIIEDSAGNEFYVDNGAIKELTRETSSVYATEAESKFQPEFENDFYIAYDGVTVSKIKKAFADLEFTRFAKADGTVIKSGKLGTGAAFTLSSGNLITVIIYGEVTGEGNINSRDLKAVLNHLSGKELLSGAFLVAADVDKNGTVTAKDALRLAWMY